MHHSSSQYLLCEVLAFSDKQHRTDVEWSTITRRIIESGPCYPATFDTPFPTMYLNLLSVYPVITHYHSHLFVQINLLYSFSCLF